MLKLSPTNSLVLWGNWVKGNNTLILSLLPKYPELHDAITYITEIDSQHQVRVLAKGRNGIFSIAWNGKPHNYLQTIPASISHVMQLMTTCDHGVLRLEGLIIHGILYPGKRLK